MREFSKKYLDLLTGEFSGINLTRIDSEEDFYQKQIMDSVLPLEKSKVFKTILESTKTMVDVGFGGGFPILPIAHLYQKPGYKFLGFDARAKKAKVVQEIANRLDIKNAKLMHQRIEEVIFDRDVLITLKAVGKVEEFLPLFKANSNIYVFFYKGPNFYELEDIETILETWDLIEEISYDVPGTEGRMLLGFKNKNVLRGTKTEKNIKFSQLL